MGDQKLIIFGVLFFVIALYACWHIHENKALKRQINLIVDAKSTQWLMNFVWSRTIQLFLIFACGILLLIAYQLQLTESRNDVETLKTQNVDLSRKLSEETARKTNEQQAPAPATSPPIPITATPPTKNSIEDVYNPEDTKTDPQSGMDEIKKRYEDMFVIYMFLKKCGKIQPTDYTIITSALSQEMASINAPGRMQYDILSAAKGSYTEIYSGSPCDGKEVDALLIQYNNYIKLLTTNFPPP